MDKIKNFRKNILIRKQGGFFNFKNTVLIRNPS